MKKLLILFGFSILLVSAQTSSYLKVGDIYMPFDNRGILAEVDEAPLGYWMTYDSIGVLFAGGFLLSGYHEDSLWANGVASSGGIADYLPGRVNSSEGDSSTYIYSVKRTDAEFDSSWQQWKHAVKAGAYFYDGDNDGFYNPIDLNQNGIWDSDEDKPDLLYDETYFVVYNDGTLAEDRWSDSEPKGIEIRQTIFVSKQNSFLRNSVFIRYSILNTGTIADTLRNVIFSLWADPDIGGTAGYSDDLVGTDTSLASVYAYNDGEDPAFGSNPPALFFTLLQGPSKFTGDENDIAFNMLGPDLGNNKKYGFKNLSPSSSTPYVRSTPDQADPDEEEEHLRNYQLGKLPRKGFIDPCNWYDGEVFGIDCSLVDPLFWYSGDPVMHVGWLEKYGADIRTMLSTGTFNLVKNEPVDIIISYTVGQGTDELNSISKARETVSYLQEEYKNNFSTIVGVEDNSEEIVKSFYLSQNYPNPFNPTTTIEYTIPSVGTSRDLSLQNTKLVVYDILGRKVKTLVNEVKSPGKYEVTFDASQLTSGIYFYRLTSGDFVQANKMMLIK